MRHTRAHTATAVVLLLTLILAPVGRTQVKEDWVARYTFATVSSVWNDTDIGNSVAIDDQGNVFVTGVSARGAENGTDIVTIKYNPSGVQVWQAVYKGPANNNDAGTVITVDTQGNVYVAGNSYGTGNTLQDFITIKYSAAGQQLWEARYDGPGKSVDAVRAMAVDAQGNVYVTGQSEGGTGLSFDIATIKYNAAGVQQWVSRYNSPSSYDDYPNAMVLDAQGNVYIAGEVRAGSAFDYVTLKYNSAGQQQWAKTFNGKGGRDDKAKGVAVDGTGNVYVTGSSNVDASADYMTDCVTIKYDPAGTVLWQANFNGAGNSTDAGAAIMVDGAGDVVVAGASHGGLSTQMDFMTIKYNSNGVKQWDAKYNASGGNTEEVHAMALDGANNIYVTGNSAGVTGRDYATVKYNPSGVQQWLMRYNGPGNAYDDALAIAVNASGIVAITGSSPGATSATDYATVRYSQTTTGVGPAAKPPGAFSLDQNFPNPFNPSTTIRFTLPASSFVTLKIFDGLGKDVAVLAAETLDAGVHEYRFDASTLSSGIYFYRLTAGASTDIKKLIVLK